MNKLLSITIISLAMGSAVFATGKFHCNEPRNEWKSMEEAKAKLESLGHKVNRVKEDDGCYELYAINKDGKKEEIYLNPKTLEIIKK